MCEQTMGVQHLLRKSQKRPYIKKQVASGEWRLLEKVRRQKSQLKKLFRQKEQLSPAFVIGDAPYKDGLRRCIEDCSYTWITFVKKQELAEAEGRSLKGKDVAEYMLSRVIDFFTEQTTNSYVMIFDKPAYVPPNKQEYQLRCYIEDSRVTEPFEWSPDASDHVLDWDDYIPCNWDALRANRAARQQAIRDVVTMIRDHYEPPAGKRLIIDSDTFAEGPLVIATNVSATQTEHYIEPRLKNSIGEGDNAIMYYIAAFSSGGADVEAHRGSIIDRCGWNGCETDDILIHCSDTDVWLSLLINYRQRLKENDFVNRVIVHLGSVDVNVAPQVTVSQTTAVAAATAVSSVSDAFVQSIVREEAVEVCRSSMQLAPPPSERTADGEQATSSVPEYIDANHLFDCVTASSMLSNDRGVLPYSTENLFVVCTMGGNDYVSGYYGLSYAVLMRTWFKMYEEIGCLVEFNDVGKTRLICINPASYLNLLIRAYWMAFEKKNITCPNPERPPKKPPVPHFSSHPRNLSLKEVRQVVQRIRKKTTDHVPSDVEISLKMLQLQWYLRYCYYSHQPELVPDPTRSGWEKSAVKYRTYFGDKGTRSIVCRKLVT